MKTRSNYTQRHKFIKNGSFNNPSGCGMTIDPYYKVIMTDLLPNLIKPFNSELFDVVQKNINRGDLDRNIKLGQKYPKLPSAILGLQSIYSIKSGMVKKEEAEHFKMLYNTEVLKRENVGNVVSTNILVECEFSEKYLLYITLYGFPSDGIFDENLLSKL